MTPFIKKAELEEIKRQAALEGAFQTTIAKIKALDDEILRLKADNHALKVMVERALKKKGDDD